MHDAVDLAVLNACSHVADDSAGLLVGAHVIVADCEIE